jgi:hypothetical protein
MWVEGCSNPALEAKTIKVTFDNTGPLGIKLDAVRMIEYIEERGLAKNSGLLPGDRLVDIGGTSVKGLAWEHLVDLLSQRPVVLTFVCAGLAEENIEPPLPAQKEDVEVSEPKIRDGEGSAAVHQHLGKPTKSKRRFSAPPARRSRSSKGPRHRWSHPARSQRTSSAGTSQCDQVAEVAGPEILDPSLAAAVPPTGLQVDENTLPRPPCSECWDWPLTRNEKKARILLIDKQVLMLDRESMQHELEVLRSFEGEWCCDA